jgi:hypothetical protein
MAKIVIWRPILARSMARFLWLINASERPEIGFQHGGEF